MQKERWWPSKATKATVGSTVRERGAATGGFAASLSPWPCQGVTRSQQPVFPELSHAGALISDLQAPEPRERSSAVYFFKRDREERGLRLFSRAQQARTPTFCRSHIPGNTPPGPMTTLRLTAHSKTFTGKPPHGDGHTIPGAPREQCWLRLFHSAQLLAQFLSSS